MAHLYAWSVTHFGRKQAERYIQGLLRRIDLLTHNPELGSKVEGSKAAIRRIAYRTHLVFYRVEPTHIRIIRVMDARRDIKLQG